MVASHQSKSKSILDIYRIILSDMICSILLWNSLQHSNHYTYFSRFVQGSPSNWIKNIMYKFTECSNITWSDFWHFKCGLNTLWINACYTDNTYFTCMLALEENKRAVNWIHFNLNCFVTPGLKAFTTKIFVYHFHSFSKIILITPLFWPSCPSYFSGPFY